MQPRITKIKNVAGLFALAGLMTIGNAAQAQLKVGSNPESITPNAVLDVQGSNGSRSVILQNGNAGFGVVNPGQSIDASGTARLRNIPSGSGTVMLTADNDGVIRKQALPVASAPVIFASLGAGISKTSDDYIPFSYTGSSITLPANSKYLIQVVVLGDVTPNTTNSQTLWVRSRFSDSPTTFANSPDIIGSPLVSGSIGSSSRYGIVQGAIIMHNKTNNPKTYYYWVGDLAATAGFTGTLRNFGNSSSGENQIYATPIN